jgi:hypothetical protein
MRKIFFEILEGIMEINLLFGMVLGMLPIFAKPAAAQDRCRIGIEREVGIRYFFE